MVAHAIKTSLKQKCLASEALVPRNNVNYTRIIMSYRISVHVLLITKMNNFSLSFGNFQIILKDTLVIPLP